MIRKYTENFSALSILPLPAQKKIMATLQVKVEQAMQEAIKKVYETNSQIRTKQNYVPLEEMLGAVKTDYSTSPLSITTYINEDEIKWRDYQDRPIHEVPFPGAPYTEYFRTAIVTDLHHHWKTPVQNYKEDDFIILKIHREVIRVIKEELPALIKQLAKGR